MRKVISAVLGIACVFATVVGFAPAAQAATQATATRSFDVTYGNTYTRGKVYFYNRSAKIVGEEKAVSSTDCRFTRATPWTAGGRKGKVEESMAKCNQSFTFELDVAIDVPGGVGYIDIELVSYNTKTNAVRVLKGQRVYRAID